MTTTVLIGVLGGLLLTAFLGFLVVALANRNLRQNVLDLRGLLHKAEDTRDEYFANLGDADKDIRKCQKIIERQEERHKQMQAQHEQELRQLQTKYDAAREQVVRLTAATGSVSAETFAQVQKAKAEVEQKLQSHEKWQADILAALRRHRDARGHARCHEAVALYAFLGEPLNEAEVFALPLLDEWLPRCVEYWVSEQLRSLQAKCKDETEIAVRLRSLLCLPEAVCSLAEGD